MLRWNRRSLLLAAVPSVMVLAGATTAHIAAQTSSQSVPFQVPTLQEQLENGLRVTRDSQRKFITRIVNLVTQKKLQLSTVYAAFNWARKRRPDIPYPYFVRAIRILAAREGVNL